ncbi:PD-(D/E)XK nuclease family protein, partial [Deinococcus sp. 6GRE01]|uniref:PD-(D/E)XK nuclease family protein n=1 Tax=Deinococcus sp. 6GRE01 TaxID=2745873 RepID=UPI001E393534
MDQAAGDDHRLTPGGVRPPVLPELLTTVHVPERFSPSGFHALERCPLSQLHGLGEAERLPPNPAALLGTVLHETVARLARVG